MLGEKGYKSPKIARIMEVRHGVKISRFTIRDWLIGWGTRNRPLRKSMSDETAKVIIDSYVPKHPVFGATAIARQQGVTKASILNLIKWAKAQG